MTRAAVAFLLAWPVLAGATPVTQIHYVMGTYLRITADGREARRAMTACFRETRRLEAVFSRWDMRSELRRLNAAGGRPTAVSADLARLLRIAETWRRRTGGAFDVRLGGLTAPAMGLPASPFDRVRARVRWIGDRVVLDGGAQLDFDGIAKGYAVDRCVERLWGAGIRSALVDLGRSSMAAIGAPAGSSAWRVPVRGVDSEWIVGEVRLRDAALSFSATQRDGRAHIVDPRRAVLVGGAAAGLVVADRATTAEVLSKALLVWGAAGPAKVERLGGAGAVRLTSRAISLGPRARRRGLFAALAAPRPPSAAEAALQ